MQNKQFLLESATVYDLKLHPQIHLSKNFLFSNQKQRMGNPIIPFISLLRIFSEYSWQK